MTDNFKEIGSLFGREGAGAGFAKQTDKESFTYAFAWPEGDTWATLTGYLNLDEQPEEYVRRVLQDGGFRSDWDNPDYDPIGDFKETAGDEYRIPLLKVLLREQLESRYEVANHFSTMNRARVELSAFIQNEGGAPLPEDALGTPEEHGIRAMLIATGEPPREVTLLPDENGSTFRPLQALVGGNIEAFDIAFGETVSLYVNEGGLFTCPPNRAIFATEEMAKAGYLSQLDYSKVVEMGDFYTVLNGDIVAVGFDPETGESRSLTDGESARVEGYFTVISEPGSGEKAVDAIRHGMEPCEYENAVSKPATERITGIRPDGAIFLRRQIAATELLSLADRYGEYLDFADEAADFAPFLYDASFSTRGAYLKVSSPGNIYREAGFPQDPFFYTYNHLRDALVPKGFYPSTVRVRHPHGLTLEHIKRLPELLERPVVLMDSDRDDTMIAVLADVDEDGFPLIAALRPGGNAVSEGRSVGGTIVCSFYGKPENYFRFKMQQMPQRVLYQDIEKGRELDARAKLQLFGGNIASPDLDRRIIRPPECIVKLRADTPQMETHGRETSRVRRESRDMASGRAALDAGRRAETARVTERHINSNLK